MVEVGDLEEKEPLDVSIVGSEEDARLNTPAVAATTFTDSTMVVRQHDGRAPIRRGGACRPQVRTSLRIFAVQSVRCPQVYLGGLILVSLVSAHARNSHTAGTPTSGLNCPVNTFFF